MAELSDYERGFHRAGLPSFIAQRTAREDIWTRAVPIMALVFGATIPYRTVMRVLYSAGQAQCDTFARGVNLG